MKEILDEINSVEGNKIIEGTLYKTESVKSPDGRTIFKIKEELGRNKILSTGSQVLACKANCITYKHNFQTLEEYIVTDYPEVTLMENDLDKYKIGDDIIGFTDVIDIVKANKLHPINEIYAGIMLLDDGYYGGTITPFNSGDYKVNLNNILMWRASELEYDTLSKEDYFRLDYDLYVKNELFGSPLYGYLIKKVEPVVSIVTPTGSMIDELTGDSVTNLVTYMDFDIAFTRSDISKYCKFKNGDDAPVKFSSFVLVMGIPLLHNDPVSSEQVQFKDIIIAHRVNIDEISLTGSDLVSYKYRVAIK